MLKTSIPGSDSGTPLEEEEDTDGDTVCAEDDAVEEEASALVEEGFSVDDSF